MTAPPHLAEPEHRWLRAVRRLAAAAVLFTGLAWIGLRDADPAWFAVPLALGPLGDATLVDVRRTPSQVHLTLEADGTRYSLRITHRRTRPDRAPPPIHRDGQPQLDDVAVPLYRVGRYRLESQPGQPRPPQDVVEAVHQRLDAWESAWPPPPAFVTAPGDRPEPWQPAERQLLDLALIISLAGLVGLAGRLRRDLRPIPLWAWGTALAIGGTFTTLTRQLGSAGVWHANAHGWDRVADLSFGVPPWNASLGLLHGFGFYTLMHPLVGGGPEGGRDVFDVATSVTFVALLFWFVALRLFLRDEVRALVGVAALAWSPLLLRVGPTEAMYVPAVLYAGGAAVAVELWLATRDRAYALAMLPPLLLCMQTRAELLLLAPAAVALRVITAADGPALRALLHPAWLGAVAVAAAASVPRLWTFLDVDKATGSGRPLVDPWRDPRSAVLSTVLLLAALSWPAIAQRLPSTAPRQRWAAAGLGVVGAVAAFAAWNMRGDGYDPSFVIHAMLDPTWSPPWLIAAPLAGVVLLRARDAAAASFLAGAASAALMLYIGRYDCLSTYLATGLATAPLLAAATSEGLVGGLERLRARPAFTLPVALLVIASGPWWAREGLEARWPKQQQWDMIVAAAAAVPDSAMLVWPSNDDLPEDLAAHGVRADRIDLGRYVGDRISVGSIETYLADEAPGMPTYFLRTLDCARPLLARDGSAEAWTGGGYAKWTYLPTDIASTAPRYRVEGISADEAFLMPECQRALRAARPMLEVRAVLGASGSIYEETQGAAPTIGLYRVPEQWPWGEWDNGYP